MGASVFSYKWLAFFLIFILLLAAGLQLAALYIAGPPHLQWIVKPPRPEAALEYFYHYGSLDDQSSQTWPVAEDMLIDPLIIAGERVVPLLLQEVQKESMPMRRYAIYFLGNGEYAEARPVLESLLQNGKEPDHIRAAALESLSNLDLARARALGQNFEKEKTTLGQMARSISSASYRFAGRSYWQAVQGLHK